MGGGVLQLASIGTEDEHLTAHPQITFFKVVFHRHTPFTMESIPQKVKGKLEFGRKVSCTIANNGDLIHSCFLEVEMEQPTVASAVWAPWLGHRLIETIDVEIGGQRIDRHTGEWLHIWYELTCPQSKRSAYKEMIGASPATYGTNKLYIPLQFWFCRHIGAALPVVCLKYHEIKIHIQLSHLSQCIVNEDTFLPIETSSTQSLKAKLFVDYIFVEKKERKRLATTALHYVIDQIQYSGTEHINSNEEQEIQLHMNHPVKELVWVVKKKRGVSSVIQMAGIWDDIEEMWHPPSSDFILNPSAEPTFDVPFEINSLGEQIYSPIYEKTEIVEYPMEFENFQECYDSQLLLNDTERISKRLGSYFTRVQPYQHHTYIPTIPIHVYSFSIEPEDPQPTGACNMSQINEIALRFSTDGEQLRVYGVNYNVLRVANGMCCLTFEN